MYPNHTYLKPASHLLMAAVILHSLYLFFYVFIVAFQVALGRLFYAPLDGDFFYVPFTRTAAVVVLYGVHLFFFVRLRNAIGACKTQLLGTLSLLAMLFAAVFAYMLNFVTGQVERLLFMRGAAGSEQVAAWAAVNSMTSLPAPLLHLALSALLAASAMVWYDTFLRKTGPMAGS